jgi:CHASE2 domain-containing sensor protein
MRFFAWSRRYWTLCASLCIGLAFTAVFVTALQGLPIFTRAELAAYDFQLQRRGPQPVLSSIVFVGVDNTSIVQLGGGSYPCSTLDGTCYRLSASRRRPGDRRGLPVLSAHQRRSTVGDGYQARR